MTRNVYIYDPKKIDAPAFEAEAVKRLPEETVIHFHAHEDNCDGRDHKIINEASVLV